MADKSLGQHWLFDAQVLQSICQHARIKKGDEVLEIGPGLGTLTAELLASGANVTAVEYDKDLIPELEDKFKDQKLKIINADILKFDFNELPKGYKIVANIPYYLTSHLLRLISEAHNRPSKVVLLVQKEVAERVASLPGEMSLLTVSIQVYADVSLGEIVPAKLFSPPPKVDSRILILDFYKEPLVKNVQDFFRMLKAGFSQPRKKLRNSLAGGLQTQLGEADELLSKAQIDSSRRPQTLSIREWQTLTDIYKTKL